MDGLHYGHGIVEVVNQNAANMMGVKGWTVWEDTKHAQETEAAMTSTDLRSAITE